jgi:hypothetical protein
MERIIIFIITTIRNKMIEITFIYTTELSNVKEYGKMKIYEFDKGYDYLDEYVNNPRKPVVLHTIQCGIRATSPDPKEVPEHINIAVIGLITPTKKKNETNFL